MIDGRTVFQNPSGQNSVPMHVHLGCTTIVDQFRPVFGGQIIVSLFLIVPRRGVPEETTDVPIRPILTKRLEAGFEFRISTLFWTRINHSMSEPSDRILRLIGDHLFSVGLDIVGGANRDPTNGSFGVGVFNRFEIIFELSIDAIIIGIPIFFADVIDVRWNICIRQHFEIRMVGVPIGNDSLFSCRVTTKDHEFGSPFVDMLQAALANFLLQVLTFEFVGDRFGGDNLCDATGAGFPVCKIAPRLRQIFIGDDQNLNRHLCHQFSFSIVIGCRWNFRGRQSKCRPKQQQQNNGAHQQGDFERLQFLDSMNSVFNQQTL